MQDQAREQTPSPLGFVSLGGDLSREGAERCSQAFFEGGHQRDSLHR